MNLTKTEEGRTEMKTDAAKARNSIIEDEMAENEAKSGAWGGTQWRNIRIFEEDTDPNAKAFGYGMVGSYVAIHAAYVLGRSLGSASAQKQLVIDFLLRHFVLSVGRVKKGRWYVLLTHAFCHYRLHVVASGRQFALHFGRH
ncbi:hypothetical protein BWQ96_07233 [Gracilariopsis chorda]|uniref:Uncharacterized protein n=1 Tax=Gracilariopsis chorda TaxID=448386 RepID=A0A2V3ILS7_9FLOR|nr:hypothetical protein BWQ96_07233 [Gracilariopsis chorda]|eukprot:PXF43036.1 hypothetical protein BWQ96_07233 [Gracilariopsis chorda]